MNMDAIHGTATPCKGGELLSGLLTDLYELTMAAAYVQNHLEARATFEVFVRHLPRQRNYLVAAGLDQALTFLENVHFNETEVRYISSLPLFRKVDLPFFDYLRRFRFTGDVWAIPEGTPFFAGEPLLRVTGPIAEVQLMETSLLSIIHFQTLIASKAARVSRAARDIPVMEFGSRRTHGLEASTLAPRASFIGGCAGTSNCYAAHRFGIPAMGTQAHSYIMAHVDEAEAFRNFLEVFPDSTLLVDTYNVRAAIDKIVALGSKPAGVRLDSGDVLADSIWVRNRLDRAGWTDVKIFASGDLDENRVEDLILKGAKIDAFGVGTALSTSADAPFLGIIYKLVEIEVNGIARGTAKFSEEKKTYPGRKQVFRFMGQDGKIARDVIGLHDEALPTAEELLIPVMRNGKRLEVSDVFTTTRLARKRFLKARKLLPDYILAITPAASLFPVQYSEALEEARESIQKLYVESAASL